MIYLLEDDSNIREFVLYALNGQNMEAVGFERPSQFWDALSRRMPELLLLDLMLPEEDGMEILRKLRTQRETQALPVILLTGHACMGVAVQGMDLGAYDYMLKPVSISELIIKMEEAARSAV